MDFDRDYTAELCRIMGKDVADRLPLMPCYVVQAVRVVKQVFPPRCTDCVFRILTALNLLNAAVKQPWGKLMVGYRFIKGYASRVLQSVIALQIPDVDYYWDVRDRIVYFRVFGIQIAFHYIPFTPSLRALLACHNNKVQQWDGHRLQQVAVELFLLGNPEQTAWSQQQKKGRARCRHGSSRRARFCRSLRTLHIALTFCLASAGSCLLYRRKDRCRVRLAFYRGDNYDALVNHLSTSYPTLYRRQEHTLKKGSLYYVSPQLHIESLPPSCRLAFLAKNCYLWDERWHCYHNLCVSYGIARYLALLYPRLRFINLLNFNRVRVRSRYYTHAALRHVPLFSKARQLKVWMVVDCDRLLRHFKVETLPASLITDYFRTPDYYQEFEVTSRHGLYGVYAYRRYHLLKPIFQRIIIQGSFAYVTRADGKVALYALREERFKSGFIYDRIWHVPAEHTTYGQIGDRVVVIFRLHPEMPFPSEK